MHEQLELDCIPLLYLESLFLLSFVGLLVDRRLKPLLISVSIHRYTYEHRSRTTNEFSITIITTSQRSERILRVLLHLIDIPI
jgi:hypothetical protein